MSPRDFIHKWSASSLKERSGSHEHFLDLCRMLEEPTPAEVDPHGTFYTFDRGAKKSDGADGWADVWKRGYFGWEYKGKNKDLLTAYAQLQRYAVALENPPLLVVSDMDTFIIHTNFTNTIHEQHIIILEDLEQEEARRLLKWVFTAPENLKPGKTRDKLTEEVAADFTKLAVKLRDIKGHDPLQVAHFVNRILFSLFAEDVHVLPEGIFKRLLQTASRRPDRFQPIASELFEAMRTGGEFGAEIIDWFNGGLFDNDLAFALDYEDIRLLMEVASKDWSAIEPSIFGTLFERGLDPDKRTQLGAHYTDRAAIDRIVNPVIRDPLVREWHTVRESISALQQRAIEKDRIATTLTLPLNQRTLARRAATESYKEAQQQFISFLDRLALIRVLDPACGSGNFLYVALQTLHDLEHQVLVEGEALGLHPRFPQVGPEAVLGIEINAYAAELSRVTIWIGEIQWRLNHGHGLNRNPILRTLDQISCRDALIDENGGETRWPDADFIIGNPPFLGVKHVLSKLGSEYAGRLRGAYAGRVPDSADLVTYWFEKAAHHVTAGHAKSCGLVSTNSIRNGSSRKVLDRVAEVTVIFNAWADQPWIVGGAAVRVSIICFGAPAIVGNESKFLDGNPVDEIFTDLTARTGAHGIDLTRIYRLSENRGVCFQGPVKVGKFDVVGELARQWLAAANPDGSSNADVVRPLVKGKDITERPLDKWIIHFGGRPLAQCTMYELPFEYVVRNIKEKRLNNRDAGRRERWWQLGRTGEDLTAATRRLIRYIATTRHANQRIFAWCHPLSIPDSAVVAIARDDSATFGILQSRFHTLWALRSCSWIGAGNDPRYTPKTTFETFPFPEGLQPRRSVTAPPNPHEAKIAEAADNLCQLRDRWMHPDDLVRRVPEINTSFPDRILPANAKAALQLKARTLNNLYTDNPSWLQQAHRQLDEAVASAYGCTVDIADEEMLRMLLGLNEQRAQRSGSTGGVADDLDESDEEED